MQVSIIIPTLNESENIGNLIRYLYTHAGEPQPEIIVVDAGSQDDTVAVAGNAGARVVSAARKGRSRQMNEGARLAGGEVLYFLHADSLPPESFQSDIRSALAEGFPMGCYRFRFDSDRLLLRFNSYMTRFKYLFVRGGDQSLFIPRKLFFELGGFREDYIIMEDFEFLVRARKQNIPFKVIQKDIRVSARKYETNSYLRVQLANFIVFTMFRLGFGQETLANAYKRLLAYR